MLFRQPRRSSHPMLFSVVITALTLLLAGCQESLHSDLTEREANEVLVTLAQAGIGASKSAGSDRRFSVDVDSNQLAAAIEVLATAGLPRERFSNLGKLFGDPKIVSTPTEERIRFQYGVSQELSETISIVDGVTAARVHLVVPKNDPLADNTKPSSASVFIKHRASLDLTPQIPSIKSLILRSVEGLTHDTVYVSLFPADPVAPSKLSTTTQPLLGVELAQENAAWVNGIAIGTLALLLASLVYLALRCRALVEAQSQALRVARRRSLSDMAGTDTLSAGQPVTAQPQEVPR